MSLLPLKGNFPIPGNYRFLKLLGEGVHGIVIKCKNKENNEKVAIKIGKTNLLHHESRIMAFVKRNNLEKYNIITFKGELDCRGTKTLAYESLEMNLQTYLKDQERLLRLAEVRIIVQQMAVALEALKGVGIIHTDVKCDNIMVVNSKRQPPRVKLTDFGLAIFKSQANKTATIQPPCNRAPEVILKLLYSEAVDVWSLGCVMARMLFGCNLFPSSEEAGLIFYMTDLLGLPPDHLLNEGLKSEDFFVNEDSKWILKKEIPRQFQTEKRRYQFRSLKKQWIRSETEHPKDTKECVRLLKAMLQWDEKERITPSGIIHNPFITKSYFEVQPQPKANRENGKKKADGVNPSTAQKAGKPEDKG